MVVSEESVEKCLAAIESLKKTFKEYEQSLIERWFPDGIKNGRDKNQR